MNDQTIDWNAEARRIARAFGIADDHFAVDKATHGQFRFSILNSRITLSDRDAHLHVEYRNDGVRFLEMYMTPLAEDEDVKPSYCNLMLEVDGTFGSLDRNGSAFDYIFARALFDLDLLTPEVETALGVRITAHQKMEWQLEH